MVSSLRIFDGDRNLARFANSRIPVLALEFGFTFFGKSTQGRRRGQKWWNMAENILLRAEHNGVGRLTLNDPARANVLSSEMMAALGATLSGWREDDGVRVVVIAAAGKIFCAGHDLAELRDGDTAARARIFATCSALMMAVAAFPKPVIACVQGAAVAAGCQLVASCDLAYAAEAAKFAVSGINLGLFCSTPGVAHGRAIGRKAAAELLYTGKFATAAEAAALGLINRAVPADALESVVQEIAGTIAAKPADAMRLGKAVFARQMDMDLTRAYQTASAAMVENLDYPAALAGIDKFLGK
jgi:enoyl-CoA hydratase/carnithine racemase